MDARIDVQAQYALFRLLQGNPAQRVEASHLLSAVKLGMLEGVYQQDQQVPALRAQSLGTWWGKILPAGSDGVCLVEPAEKPPLIALRRGTPSDTSRYDAALIDAWLQCSIGMNVPVRPYDATAAGDPPATGAAQSCRGASQLAEALQACQDWYQQRVGHCQRRLLARAQGDPELARQMELQLGDGADCASQSSAMRATCEQQAHAGCQ